MQVSAYLKLSIAVAVATIALKAGAWWPETITKILRAQEIAQQLRRSEIVRPTKRKSLALEGALKFKPAERVRE